MSEEKKFRVAHYSKRYGKNYESFHEMLRKAHEAGATRIEMYDATNDVISEKAARVSQLESEIAELKAEIVLIHKWASNQHKEDSDYLYEVVCNHKRQRKEHEARTQKLVEALENYCNCKPEYKCVACTALAEYLQRDPCQGKRSRE